ncbi:MAG: hypothetical protein HRT47_07090 [Candidatus Caenarcaniphilales bacterium]|nr:hypothetical protein [Candidatus Caenarcaniphilales bacterium]
MQGSTPDLNNKGTTVVSNTATPELTSQSTEQNKNPKTQTNPENQSQQIDNLHQTSTPVSPGMEQIRRLQELREVLMSGDTVKNTKNDAIALDLVGVVKSNLDPSSAKLGEHAQLLNELEALITDQKFSDANSKITEIAKSFEDEIKAKNFTPQKNTAGGGFFTLIDTVIQNFLGNVAGPATVKFVEETLGIPIKKANLGAAEVHAEVAAGVTGFQAAEVLIGGHMLGLPFKIPGWHGIDPIFENLSKKFTNWIETKTPNFKINFNNTVDKVVKKAVNLFVGLFGKNKNAKAPEGTKVYDDELQGEIDNYIKKRHEIEHQDPEARVNIVKKMVHADFENKTGKKMMKPLHYAMNYAFKTTDNNHFTKNSLLMNELALAIKPYLDKLGPVGGLAYNFLYTVVPNLYIFGSRPVGQYMLHDKEKYLIDRANDIKHILAKPLEPAAAH